MAEKEVKNVKDMSSEELGLAISWVHEQVNAMYAQIDIMKAELIKRKDKPIQPEEQPED